jgi:hypothetical protein
LYEESVGASIAKPGLFAVFAKKIVINRNSGNYKEMQPIGSRSIRVGRWIRTKAIDDGHLKEQTDRREGGESIRDQEDTTRGRSGFLLANQRPTPPQCLLFLMLRPGRLGRLPLATGEESAFFRHL